VFCFHYSGIEGLIEALSKYLCYESLTTETPLPPISIRCFSEGYGIVIQQSIEQIFTEAAACFKSPGSGNTRYLLQSANEYHILQIIDDVPKYSHIANQQMLLRTLGQTQSAFCPLIFNANTLSHSPLPDIYRSNKPGRIQLYFRVIEDTAHIYILDEMGSLYYQPQPFHDYSSLLNHYALFLMAIVNRRQHTLHSADSQQEEFPLDFYECIKNNHKEFILRPVKYSQQDIPNQHFDVQVICTQDSGEHKNVTIYCDGHEFSTMEYGGELFSAVARHVMKFRQGKDNYPVYITDIDLSESASPMNTDTEVQTAHYLAYKKSIELHLNKAMQNL
jgi:adenylate cyclase class 1